MPRSGDLRHVRRLYEGTTETPASHLADLARQIEAQTCRYEVQEETVEVALALVKPDRFATEEDLARDERGEAAITVEGRKAVALKKWVGINDDRLKYEIIFAREETVPYNQTKMVREFVEAQGHEP